MRIYAITLRIVKQFLHDKRTLVQMLIAPLLVLLLLSLVFNGHDYEPKIGVVQVPTNFIQTLENEGAHVTLYETKEGEAALRNNKIDALISFEEGELSIWLEGSDPAKSRSVLLVVQGMMQLNPATSHWAKPNINYLHGSADMTAFDNFGPVLIGVFSFFFVFLIAGISFLRESTRGTLERLLASPLSRYEIVFGYIFGFGIFTLTQAGLIAWFAIEDLGILMAGSFWFVLLVTFMLSLVALTLGILISTFANNEFQVIQFIPLIVVPQVLFSGLFNLDSMSHWIRGISIVMPLKYGANALRNVMIRGQGWTDIWVDLLILGAFSLLFISLNLLALRKYRKI